ncbi:MAG: hypothetical protein QOI83_4554 [Streptomycetaceae bacterium]|jgi:catechol 2,3-dioxygenase-like lactoylglutathione lyase family enzyme|nr:hypothetical protein [Streptomycetaceae bacterium]
MRPPTPAAVSPTESFIHHIGVFASDHAASRAFYTAVLAPLGIRAGYQADGVAEYWTQPFGPGPSTAASPRGPYSREAGQYCTRSMKTVRKRQCS